MAFTIIFGILAIASAAYYFVMISYAGTATVFAPVWLAMAAVFAVVAVVGFVLHHRHVHLPVALKIVFFAFIGIGLAFFITVESMIISAMTQKAPDDLDYIIVLGAHVKGDVASKTLAKRIDAAAAYLAANPDTIAIVSGGKGDGENISEAQCMKDGLTERGIDAARIIMEDCSTSTEENISFSTRIIDSRSKGATIGVVTSNFHIFRAVKVCAKQGYEVCGIPAKSDNILFVNYIFREFFAVVRYRMTGVI